MRVWSAVGFFLILGAVSALSQPVTPDNPAAILVRTSLQPTEGAVVGQRVALYVDVLFAESMARPPRVSVSEIPGMQVFRFETQGTTMSDTVAGSSYIGQRFEFALFPRRGGEFTVPPAAITILKRDGDVAGHAVGPSISLNVIVPPGIDISQPVIASTKLTLIEQWSPPRSAAFKPGDALKRTIRREARDIPGAAIAPLPLGAPEGVRVYADPAEIGETVDRGDLTGHRVDRVTYVFEKTGDYTLPALNQPWWDLGAGMAREAGSPPVTIRVVASTGPAALPEGRLRGLSDPRVLASALALLVGGLWLSWVIGVRVGKYVTAWRKERARSEEAAFSNLRRTCLAGDPAATYRALAPWRLLFRETIASPITDDVEDELKELTKGLERVLFALDRTEWSSQDGKTLAEALRAFRMDRRRRRGSSARRMVLPPLNPAAGAEPL